MSAHTCPDCGWTVRPDAIKPAASLAAHRRVRHPPDVPLESPAVLRGGRWVNDRGIQRWEPGPPPAYHGRINAYRRGCRCEPCRDAKRATR